MNDRLYLLQKRLTISLPRIALSLSLRFYLNIGRFAFFESDDEGFSLLLPFCESYNQRTDRARIHDGGPSSLKANIEAKSGP